MSAHELAAGGYSFRPLKEGLRGWDVAALQYDLTALGYKLEPDGVFGIRTEAAVHQFQGAHGLKPVDGVAGPMTQREIALQLIWPAQRKHRTPPGLMRGQVEAESSLLLGNYTAPYDDGTCDIGLVMLHRAPTEEALRFAFDGGRTVPMLAKHLRERKDRYYGQPGAKTHQRAWELAAGSWNAPAWTDRLAAGKPLTASQQQHIDSYIGRVTRSVADWTP